MLRHSGSFRPSDFFILLAVVVFFIASFGYVWRSDPWPWSGRLIAFGLFCWSLSTML